MKEVKLNNHIIDKKLFLLIFQIVYQIDMATATLSVPEQRIGEFLDDLLNLEAIEVGFNCFLMHRPDLKKANEVIGKQSNQKLVYSIHVFRIMQEKS